MERTGHAQLSGDVAFVIPSTIPAPIAHGLHCVFPTSSLCAFEPQGVQPTIATVASPPYPAEHSQRPVSVFISAFDPHTQEPELVASVSPSAMLDPAGHDVHCVLPTSDLYDVVPQALHPTLATVASPPYPAEHSQRPVSVFISAFAPHTQESELVASVSPSAIDAPGGHDSHCVFPTFGLNAVVPHTVQPTAAFVASPP